MGKFKSHISLLLNALNGTVRKWTYRFRSIPSLKCDDTSHTAELVVSLTSFGRRVNNTVYYTILSIFNQTLPPNRIVLWLDSDNWNKDNLPEKLKKLTNKGLEIRFCEDIRSYKKLIPTLELYPDAIIITVDDDVIYSPKLIESLYNSYMANPNAVHCSYASKVRFVNQVPVPYRQWIPADSNICEKNEYIFPIGIGGVLYPPHAQHLDVLDRDKFRRLAPEADDMWFWYMARINGRSHCYVPLKPNIYSFDAIYQALHRGSALTHSNVGENRNDVQLAAILKEYKNKKI